MRILIIEDDPMIGAGIRTGLRQDGYTADWARDSNSAELAVATNEYDAILLLSLIHISEPTRPY